ncbi:MAG: cytochrome c [Verrucomicrobia bacterium]|nr:cytochrome c [Verrucomicrobiota bacterium]
MRYFLLIFFLTGVLVVGIAGFRGDMSRRPPIELFPDMDRQPKLRPQERNTFFADERSSRLPVAGTVARSLPYRNLRDRTPDNSVYPFHDTPVNTGLISGTTNFVEVIPFHLTEQLMERGRDRYQIYCSPCHGPLGDANGPVKKLGMATVANLHDKRILEMADGQIFYAITHGSPSQLMGPYAAQVSVEDRWAIVAYVRALQRSRLGDLEDVPEPDRSALKK